jgi:hypothetical protein
VQGLEKMKGGAILQAKRNIMHAIILLQGPESQKGLMCVPLLSDYAATSMIRDAKLFGLS